MNHHGCHVGCQSLDGHIASPTALIYARQQGWWDGGMAPMACAAANYSPLPPSPKNPDRDDAKFKKGGCLRPSFKPLMFSPVGLPTYHHLLLVRGGLHDSPYKRDE